MDEESAAKKRKLENANELLSDDTNKTLQIHNEEMEQPMKVSSDTEVDQQDSSTNSKHHTFEASAAGTIDSVPQDAAREATGDTEVATEKDVGITEYVSKHDGFSGVIKQRYSDFLVNEINMNGAVVHLTSTSVPEQEEESIKDVLTAENRTELQTLKDGGDVKGEVLIKVGEDKEERSQVHKAIRKLFPGLESSTVDKNGEKFIRAFVPKPKFGRDRRPTPWPSGRPDYCTFTLYKENRDTLEALGFIAKLLKLKAAAFTFAGTKDKRAKTCQEVSVLKVDAERLSSLQKALKQVVLGNFRYTKDPVRLGYLRGNRFSIVLRNVLGSNEEIEKAMTSLQQTGFINYYGMQRFGTTSVPTHHVGRAFIKSQWNEVIDLIMKPRRNDQDEIYECRKVWSETRDAKSALAALRSRECVEKHLLFGLQKCNAKDLVNALAYIPRNSRMMYLHSYQSYVWNCLASRRVRQYGLVPIVGDLVMEEKDYIEGIHDDRKEQTRKLKVVTAENRGDYSIHDVVLPLPGFDVQYPHNEVADWYAELLEQDGLNVDSFRNKIRDYSLSGDYRRLVVLPSELKWSVCQYDDVQLPLISSDLDRLEGTAVSAGETDGAYKALILEINLPSSSYATMAIRDILKMDTSSAFQTTLNVN